jgi:hypothetical protein
MHPIALAMQGMAFWHLLLGVAALAFTLTLVATGASLDDNSYVISGMSGAEVTGGSMAAALILGGISWAMMGRAFWRPRWSIILVPGLIGTLTSCVLELMDWPASYLIGGFAAYWVFRTRLDQQSPADSANS